MKTPFRLAPEAFEDLGSLRSHVVRMTGEDAAGAAVLIAFHDSLERVLFNPEGAELAPDPAYEDDEVRHAFFSTRSGRTHRFLFRLQGGYVEILRVRSASQDLIR